MTPVSVHLPVRVAHPTSAVFCDKKFKFVRVLVDLVSQSCLALFYKIISLGFWIVNARISHHYQFLASYHLYKTHNFFNYLIYGKEIVDFSMNCSTQIKELLPNSINEYQALKEMYGQEVIERFSQIGTSEVPLQIDRLSRKEGDECCFGMSIDFISNYLQRIRSGSSALEAVKSIASRYVNGIPLEAQLIQIFYHALDTSHLEKLFKLANEERLKALEKINNGFVTELLMDRVLNVSMKKEQIIAKHCGLAIQQPIIYACIPIENVRSTEFKDFIDKLSNGIYKVGFCKKNSAHVIVFIKTLEGPHFIYDPNHATLAIKPSESADRLLELAEVDYIQKGVGWISFFSCTLQ